MTTQFPIYCHTGGHRFTAAVTANMRCVACGSPDIDLDEREAAKTADFTDMEMDRVKETSSVTQRATCSTCFTEHTVDAVDPAQPMPACPSCGANTLTVAGATVASRKVSNLGTPEKCAFCDKTPTSWSQWLDSTGNSVLSTNYYCAEHERAKFNWSGQAQGGSMTSPPTIASRKTAETEFKPGEPCPHCGGSVSKTADAGSPLTGVDRYKCSQCLATFSDLNSAKSARRVAKIRQIAAGVLATNPGMNRREALRVAKRTVARYPQVVPKHAAVGQCDWCSRTGELTPVEGEKLCWPCTNAYLDDAAKHMRVMVDGVETELDPNKVTPRAWRYR